MVGVSACVWWENDEVLVCLVGCNGGKMWGEDDGCMST